MSVCFTTLMCSGTATGRHGVIWCTLLASEAVGQATRGHESSLAVLVSCAIHHGRRAATGVTTTGISACPPCRATASLYPGGVVG